MGSSHSKRKPALRNNDISFNKYPASIQEEITHLKRVKRLVFKYLRPLLTNQNEKACKELKAFYRHKVLYFQCPHSSEQF